MYRTWELEGFCAFGVWRGAGDIHAAVSETLDSFDTPPAFLTIHTFAPTWHGASRPVELGILHDADDSLALRLLTRADPALKSALNEPYSARDGVTHTLAVHAGPRGLQNAMIEVRNDLLADDEAVDRMADRMAPMISGALSPTEVVQ